VFLLLAFCKNESNSKKTTPAENPGILSQIEIEDLVNKVDYVDFLFYHLNISVSQNDKPSIAQSCRFLTTGAKLTEMNCPAIGRVSFQSLGKIILEADMHLAQNCGYFTIIENKKEKGTSLMSPDGVKFLNALVDGYKTK
jgi:hypothetical protein